MLGELLMSLSLLSLLIKIHKTAIGTQPGSSSLIVFRQGRDTPNGLEPRMSTVNTSEGSK